MLGDKTKAKAHYEKLVALAGGSGADRRELATSRRKIPAFQPCAFGS